MADHLWKPGQSGNPAGRPKGSPNKRQQDFDEALGAFLGSKVGDLEAMYQAGDTELRLRILKEFLPYWRPRKAAQDTRLSIEKMTTEELDELMQKLLEDE